MNKIIAKWTLGNFSVSLTADVSDSQLHAVAEMGMLALGYRMPKLDDTLSGMDSKARKAAKFKRSAVGYSPDMASKLKALFESGLAFDKEAGVDPIKPLAYVTEYVPTVAGAKKFTKAIAWLDKMSDDKLAAIAAKVGWTGEIVVEGVDGADDEYPTEFLALVDAQLALAEERARKALEDALG